MHRTFLLSPFAVLVLDEVGRVLDANPAALELLDVTRDELLGTSFTGYIAHPQSRIGDALRGGVLSGAPFRTNVRLKTTSERLAAAELTIVALHQQGEDPRYGCYLVDTTERLAAEQRRSRLLRLEHKARLAAEAARKRVGILARMGELTYSLDLNETLGRIAGLAVEGFATHCVVYLLEEEGSVRIGAEGRAAEEDRDCALFLDESHPVPAGSVTATALTTGDPVLLSGEDVRIDEVLGLGGAHTEALRQLGPCSAMLLPMRARGAVNGAIAYFNCGDTGTPFTEDDLRFAQSLAQSAAFAIDNAQLYRTAREAVEARQELLAVVAHDLRSPLGAISVSTELLHDRALEENWRRHHLEIIQHASARMSRLIQDLLDIAKIEHGQLSIEVTPQEIGDLLSEAHSLFAPRSWNRGIDLAFDVPDTISRVFADRYRIQQVLTNLLDNAIKFNRPGGRVRMAAAEVEGFVRFTVWNSGPPIPREDLANIFDRFWRSGADGTGAGLGLSIAKAIVDSHGGEIRAESSAEEGTTISFTLPKAHDRRRMASGW